jgi:hypothetical protein
MLKKPFSLSVILSLICFSQGMEAQGRASTQKEECGKSPHPMHATLRHIEGKGIGYDTGYTTLEAFFAHDTEIAKTFPFVDLRGHVFDNGKFAANAGFGLRQIIRNRVYGGNIYYDYRNTHRFHYNQVGVGFESLGQFWDFRFNGYFPIGDKKSRGYHTKFDEFLGHHLYMTRKYEFAMAGADAEVGFHFGKTKNFDFYGAPSLYYFSGQLGSQAIGGKVRVVGYWKRLISLEVSDSYDTVFKNNFQGQLGISVPFGRRAKRTRCKEPKALRDRLVQPVGRDEIIVLNTHRKKTIAINPLTGQPYSFFFVNNTSNSLGTFESPYPTLLQAQQASSPHDIIYIFPGDNTATGLDQGIALQDNQQLLGARLSYVFPTTKGSVKVPSLASTYSVLTNVNKGLDVISIANNNVIAGLYIQNFNGSGAAQNDPSKSVSNLKVIDNIFQGTGGNALNLNNVGGLVEIYNNKFNVIHNVTLPAAPIGEGVVISNSLPIQNSRYRIVNNIFSGTGISYNLQDNSHISISILNNYFFTSLASIRINMNNTSAAGANTFEIQKNKIYSSQINIQSSLNGFANGVFNISNNQAFAAGNRGVNSSALQNTNVSFNFNDNAEGQLNLENNSFRGAGGCLSLNSGSSANITSTISNNDFVGGGPAIQMSISTPVNTSLFNCTISGNSLIAPQNPGGIRIQTDQSSVSSFTIAANITDGISIESFSDAQTVASISNNEFLLTEGTNAISPKFVTGGPRELSHYSLISASTTTGALNLTTNDKSQADWSVLSNTFIGPQGNAANIIANSNSSLSLTFNNNSATPIQSLLAPTAGTYNLQNNSTGTFDIQSTRGNFGLFYGNVPVTPMDKIKSVSQLNLNAFKYLWDQLAPPKSSETWRSQNP